MLVNYFKLCRPNQWLKNGFIFLPAFFSGQLLDFSVVKQLFVAFLSYSLIASAIYCFNDIYDAEKDKLHPVKCARPIASGSISKAMGFIVMLICIVLSFGVLFAFRNIIANIVFLLSILLFYFFLNIAYCLKLKNWAIVDVFVIAIGFVLRVFAGGVVTDIYVSPWIILMTFLLALFLAFAKRRDDVVLYADTGVKMRKSVNRYNLDFMNQTITIIATITMVAYIMYTVSPEVILRMGTERLYFTSMFVLSGILRYLQLTLVDLKSGSPTKILLTDHFIQFCVLGWGLSFILIIYLT